jgi:hypothetical protein
MSAGTLTIQLPSRACWWIKKLAKEQQISVRDLLEQMVLKELHHTPGVDLSRSPTIHKEG